MAVIFNKSNRGFILKSGILEAGKHMNMADNEAKKLAGMYPNEIEIVQVPVIVKEVKEEAKEEKPQAKPEAKEEVKGEAQQEPVAEKKPAKKGSKK